MRVHTAPEPGDVVVRSESRHGDDLYLLRTIPGPDQFRFGSRDEAVALATLYARDEHVRAWFQDGTGFSLLEDARMTPDQQVLCHLQ